MDSLQGRSASVPLIPTPRYPVMMDDRSLIAVAEQAAATAKVMRNPIEGATILYDDGSISRGCRMEYEDPSLDQDAASNAIAAGRSVGAYRPLRVGIYSPVSEGLPELDLACLQRLKAVSVAGLEIILSSGSGDRVARSLEQMLAAADA
ncbi:MAG: hypothetical protein QF489_03470 [Planctomycetota bacterium]|nr:hypothetical protein [Planctomycetota bacterium]